MLHMQSNSLIPSCGWKYIQCKHLYLSDVKLQYVEGSETGFKELLIADSHFSHSDWVQIETQVPIQQVEI